MDYGICSNTEESGSNIFKQIHDVVLHHHKTFVHSFVPFISLKTFIMAILDQIGSIFGPAR